MNTKKHVLMLNFLLLACFLMSQPCWACSGSGPADPVTGMITYPPEAGKGTAIPSTSDLAGTPFEGGKFYKGWKGKEMKLMVVPVGTTLAFEGVIQSTTGSAPEYWEEGIENELKGTTVDEAPKPTWTISGNGRGDFRGTVPPTAAGFDFKMFEQPPSCMIVDDTPAVKALWKLTYDRDSAISMLMAAWNDPVLKLSITSGGGIPSDFDMDEVVSSGREPMADDGAKDLNEYEISPTGSDGVDGLREGLDSTLTQRSGTIFGTSAPISRDFVDPDGNPITVTYPEQGRMIVKAGYIAMQEWYPSGRYNTKYYITPPSAETYEVGNSKLQLSFNTPSIPDFWVIDLHSGLESCKDCIWAWIELEGILKAEGSTISDPTDMRNFYEVIPNTYAVGGVFVRGYYQSGNSSAGRNTKTYVAVADTRSPAHYRWLTSGLQGETGKTLGETNSVVKFRVFDNNPVIGASSFNSVFTEPDLEGLSAFQFVPATLKPVIGATSIGEVFTKYLAPFQDATTEFPRELLKPELYYSYCSPAYASLKVKSGAQKEYPGPIPIVNDRVVYPLQRFLWTKVDSDSITVDNFKMYTPDGNTCTSLGDLLDMPNWKGYSSYDVTVNMTTGAKEPMGFGYSDKSKGYAISLNDLELETPATSKLADGVPVADGKIRFWGWEDKGVKMFGAAGDGVNQSPRASSVEKIINSKFAAMPRPISEPKKVDYVCFSEEPTTFNHLLSGQTLTTICMGDVLGNACNYPPSIPPAELPIDFAWGKFQYISSLEDKGKPNIALEVLNSKNEKRVIYGNLYADGEHEKICEALTGAGASNWVGLVGSNSESVAYTSAAAYDSNDFWEFKDKVDDDLYMAMKSNMDEGKFQPWLFAFPAAFNNNKIWPKGYWNGVDTYNSDRLAFHQGSSDRLVFRYWTWDNINMLYPGHTNFPCGVKELPGDGAAAMYSNSRFKNVIGFQTCGVKLIDRPGNNGEVLNNKKVWWPDYIFHNPSSGDTQECSLQLTCEDESGNERKLKLWFNVIAPKKEMIRTLEDKRNRLDRRD